MVWYNILYHKHPNATCDVRKGVLHQTKLGGGVPHATKVSGAAHTREAKAHEKYECNDHELTPHHVV